jgi:hypothetical protein
MIIRYLDIPVFMYNSSEGYSFFEALDKHKDLEIFGRASVQILINHREHDLMKFYYAMYIIPYMIYFVTFIYWTNYGVHSLLTAADVKKNSLGLTDTLIFKLLNPACWILIVGALYFAFISIVSVYKQPHLIFKPLSFWITLCTSILVLYCVTKPGILT